MVVREPEFAGGQERQEWPRSSDGASGSAGTIEIFTAIPMIEPGAGSDLQGIRTTAEDRGDHWLLNGS
ncbi:hypothetical protein ACWD60_41540, partial [Streptomyces sp. NPDC005167]